MNEFFEVMRNNVTVEKRTLDVFTQFVQTEFNFSAELSKEEAARTAQRVLFASKHFDPKELFRALLKRVELRMREDHLREADDPERVRHFLNVILAAHPRLLRDAEKAARAATTEVHEADELPDALEADGPLPVSAKNVYRVIPEEMNSWERSFAGLLDGDPNNQVRWWHRNLPHKPWSVNLLLPEGDNFFPDFVIGVEGRRKGEGVLLADPKFGFERSEEQPKVLAAHRTYGRVLIVYREGESRWMTVEYDQVMKKARATRDFKLSDMAGF
jgi:hypothetical protein